MTVSKLRALLALMPDGYDLVLDVGDGRMLYLPTKVRVDDNTETVVLS